MFPDAPSNNIRALNLECNFYLLREKQLLALCTLFIFAKDYLLLFYQLQM